MSRAHDLFFKFYQIIKAEPGYRLAAEETVTGEAMRRAEIYMQEAGKKHYGESSKPQEEIKNNILQFIKSHKENGCSRSDIVRKFQRHISRDILLEELQDEGKINSLKVAKDSAGRKATIFFAIDV